MWNHRAERRIALVDPAWVAGAGFPVVASTPSGRQIVLHRHEDGRWGVVDRGQLDGLPDELQRRAIELAGAIISGLDLVGRATTSLEVAVGCEVRWSAVWRSRHRRRTERCPHGPRRGGMGC